MVVVWWSHSVWWWVRVVVVFRVSMCAFRLMAAVFLVCGRAVFIYWCE